MFIRGFIAALLSPFVVLGLFVAGVPVVADRPPYEPVSEVLVEERMQAEQQAAHSLGFSDSVESIPFDDPAMRPSVELAPDTCVAVVAGAWGSHHIRALALVPSGTGTGYRPHALSGDLDVGGLVASTQFCTRRARSLELVVQVRELAPMEPEAGLHGLITLQRAAARAVGGTGSLRRGWVLPDESSDGADASTGADAGAGIDAGTGAEAGPPDAP
ncbi:MAG: hypothetical protein AB8I08_16625 [Sandaracinaceae bacterium]